MRKSPEALAEYANCEARELCLYLEQASRGLYNSVQYIRPHERPREAPPNLFLHRTDPATWDDGVVFTLFAFDDGDLAYEPRLQIIEEALRRREEVFRIERMTAPDSMVKDMLLVEIVLRDRRHAPESVGIDGRNA